jgi:hypothetical protein
VEALDDAGQTVGPCVVVELHHRISEALEKLFVRNLARSAESASSVTPRN